MRDQVVHPATPTVLGRESECRTVDGLLSAALAGSSNATVVLGDLGVGKSTLLRYAVARADELGMQVLRCRGLEAESSLSYAGLADLLRPISTRIDRLPAPQATELRAALALGPPATGNRFLVYQAALGMLDAATDDGPVLLVVDDLQWVDRPSAEALLFAARRLGSEGVVALVAIRDDADKQNALGDVDISGLDQLVLTGLSVEAGTDLVLSYARSPVSPGVARQLASITRGNPLALVQLSRRLPPQELAGTRPLRDLPQTAVDEALRKALIDLPTPTSAALLVVACSDETAHRPMLAAMAEIGLTATDLEPAEIAGLLETDVAGIRFRHPLMRSVVNRQASPAERRRVHRALALVAHHRGEPDREAWHAAAALTGPDDAAADALARTAADARDRGGPIAAARALERAAEVTARPDRRVELLSGAAREALTGGAYSWSLDVVRRIDPESATPARQVEVVALRAAVEQACGSAQTAHALLLDLGTRLMAADPAGGATLLAGAALAAIQAGQVELAVSPAAAAAAAVPRTPREDSPAELLCAATLAVTRGYAAESSETFGAVLRVLADDSRPCLPLWPSILPFAIALAQARGHDDVARGVLESLVTQFRAASALGLLPIFLSQLAEQHFRDGRWYEAYAEALEALTLARETGQSSSGAHALVVLARLEACRGDEQSCLRHLREATDPHSADDLVKFPREAARGLLELSLGRAEQAILPLLRLVLAEDRQGLHEPAMFSWLPDLIEAYVKTGRTAEATDLLSRFDTEAPPAAWTTAVAARCRGLLASDDAFEHEFAVALESHGAAMPFERARTELCLGERLRRSRRRAAALPVLDSAAAAFSRLGARPWAELAIAGGQRVLDAPDPARRLTPQELQIALLVSRGSSNREVATTLFLSEKTIEAHLTRIYRSLGVRSRGRLAEAMRSETVSV
jgi:DNA-binding CsgD family transcriptional regulator